MAKKDLIALFVVSLLDPKSLNPVDKIIFEKGIGSAEEFLKAFVRKAVKEGMVDVSDCVPQ